MSNDPDRQSRLSLMVLLPLFGWIILAAPIWAFPAIINDGQILILLGPLGCIAFPMICYGFVPAIESLTQRKELDGGATVSLIVTLSVLLALFAQYGFAVQN